MASSQPHSKFWTQGDAYGSSWLRKLLKLHSSKVLQLSDHQQNNHTPTPVLAENQGVVQVLMVLWLVCLSLAVATSAGTRPTPCRYSTTQHEVVHSALIRPCVYTAHRSSSILLSVKSGNCCTTNHHLLLCNLNTLMNMHFHATSRCSSLNFY